MTHATLDVVGRFLSICKSYPSLQVDAKDRWRNIVKKREQLQESMRVLEQLQAQQVPSFFMMLHNPGRTLEFGLSTSTDEAVC